MEENRKRPRYESSDDGSDSDSAVSLDNLCEGPRVPVSATVDQGREDEENDDGEDFLGFGPPPSTRGVGAASLDPEALPPWLDEPCWTIGNDVGPMAALHNEVLRFCDLVSPTAAERSTRHKVVRDITDVLESLYPGCEVVVFGSELTGLALPSSDLDMGCLNVPERGGRPLHRFADALRSSGLVSQLEVVEFAKVPIVKLVHAATQVSSCVRARVCAACSAPRWEKSEFVCKLLTPWPSCHSCGRLLYSSH